MRISELVRDWEENASARLTATEYAVRLPLYDAARLAALAEMYPGRTQDQIITDLLSAALDELEESLPYVQGSRVVSEDEFGDPIYEDAGPTPRLQELTRKHFQQLKRETEAHEQQQG
ncbi:MAG: type 1 pili tip component [Gammaproteobacteria bacterium]|nr:type 1 pili tip component [Gammaproteobacteria bacterium]